MWSWECQHEYQDTLHRSQGYVQSVWLIEMQAKDFEVAPSAPRSSSSNAPLTFASDPSKQPLHDTSIAYRKQYDNMGLLNIHAWSLFITDYDW